MTGLAYGNGVSLDVDKTEPLIDDVIRIRVLGLVPCSQITVHVALKEKGHDYGSTACFNVDEEGIVDLSQRPSIQGTYTGVHPMGLFWSMIAAPHEPPGLRLFKRDASKPLVTTISVYQGKINFEEFYTKQYSEPLVSKTIYRWYMGKGVQRITVNHGRLRGSVFIPTGDGPFPALIDMFGTAGSLAEFRAALFASRGFVAYALPYFAHEDLPSVLYDLQFEYFMEAIDWFSQRPYVNNNGIGVIGVSKGGEIALQMAYHNAKVKAVVSINGAPFLSSFPMTFQDRFIGMSNMDFDQVLITHEGTSYRDVFVCDPKDYLPLHEKDTPVLLIAGEDDLAFNCKYLELFYNTYPENRRHLIELCVYPGAGHLIEPPYSPMSRFTSRTIKEVAGITEPEVVLWGGNCVQHAAAQEQSWFKIIDFFRGKLQQRPITSHL